jgi:hypothetical protein
MHSVFVDESQRANVYALCSVSVEFADFARVRAALARLRAQRTSRLHMKQESKETRHRAIDLVAGLDRCSILLVRTARGRTPAGGARARAVAALVTHTSALTAAAIVFERSPTHVLDVAIASHVRRTSGLAVPDVRHENPEHEPLLWLPDIVAWTLGRTDGYRERADFPNLTIVDV